MLALRIVRSAQPVHHRLGDRLEKPFLASLPARSPVDTVFLNRLVVLLMGLIGLLVLFLAPAFSDTYCSFHGMPEEGIGISQRASPWPFGTRCTYDLADGTTLVIGPRRASALLPPSSSPSTWPLWAWAWSSPRPGSGDGRPG